MQLFGALVPCLCWSPPVQCSSCSPAPPRTCSGWRTASARASTTGWGWATPTRHSARGTRWDVVFSCWYLLFSCLQKLIFLFYICFVKNTDSWRRHIMKRKVSGVDNRCNQCGKQYKEQSGLRRHIRSLRTARHGVSIYWLGYVENWLGWADLRIP